MKNIETYIFVHDQEIILDFISKNRFSDLENVKYVFLSHRKSDKIEHLKNVIIIKNYENNLENYPKLTSFTGWYILWKNNIIKSDYVNLFEYDINYIKQFPKINIDLINKNFDIIGYFPMLINDPVYIKMRQYVDGLITSIKNKTNIDIDKLINMLYIKNNNSVWSSSSNSTWKVSEWIKYMNWFSNFIEDIKDNPYCGHMHERSISFFYFIYNLNVINMPHLMEHLQLNTHGTSPLEKERFNNLYNNLK